MRPIKLALALLVCSAFNAAHAGVHVVGSLPGPGVDFTDIQSAIDAAVDGDVIVVKSGTFPDPIVIDGKSLIVDAIGNTYMFSNDQGPAQVLVKNLGPDQSVNLRRFFIELQNPLGGTGLQVLDCEGRVWLEEFSVTNAVGDGIVVRNSAQVVMTDVSSSVGVFSTGTDLPRAVHAFVIEDGSNVQAYNLTAWGSTGGLDSSTALPLEGGDAMRLTDSTLTLMAGAMTGGGGGSALVGGCLLGAPGGAGLRVIATGVGPAPVVDLVTDSGLYAGESGASDSACAIAPRTTLYLETPAGVVTHLGGEARVLHSPTVAYPGADLWGSGPVGETVIFIGSLASSAPFKLPGVGGSVLIDPSHYAIIGAGVIQSLPSGAFAVVSLPGFPSQGYGLTAYFQAVHLSAQGELWLSSPRSSLLN